MLRALPRSSESSTIVADASEPNSSVALTVVFPGVSSSKSMGSDTGISFLIITPISNNVFWNSILSEVLKIGTLPIFKALKIESHIFLVARRVAFMFPST